jgi:plasmid stabilization system protein ParE
VSRVLHRRPEVFGDIIQLAEYISRDNLEAALRFFDAVELTIDGLGEMPGKGSLRAFERSRIRTWQILDRILSPVFRTTGSSTNSIPTPS